MYDTRIFLFRCMCCGDAFIHKAKVTDIQHTEDKDLIDAKCPICGKTVKYFVNRTGRKSEVDNNG